MNDALLLERLATELNQTLQGGRIDKVNMPEHDEIILTVRARSANFRLLINASGHSPRIHLTQSPKENPITAPSFLMHLRKHIGGGIIESIESVKYERAVIINIIHNNELMVPEKVRLIAEIMGQFSNIILCDSRGIISGCVKQVSLDMSGKRQIFPSIEYALPPAQDKLTPEQTEEIKSLLRLFTGGRIDKYMSKSIGGLAPYSIAEAVYRALGTTAKDTLNANETEKILSALASLYTIPAEPCVTISNNAPVDFLPFPYQSLQAEMRNTNSISEAIEFCMSEKDKTARFNEKARPLLTVLKSCISKNEKRILALVDKRRAAEDFEKFKVYGELILSNLYKLKKGDTELTAENYYDNNSLIKIPLDIQLAPSANAQRYFKQYNKSKRTLTHTAALLEQTETELDYLYSIQEAFRKCNTVTELNELKSEMEAAGFTGNTKNTPAKKSKKQDAPSMPLHFIIGGFDIYAGKNNFQNENLTLKTAAPNDIFLHARNVHGSHVLIVTGGKDVPQEVILAAARIAANKSKAYMSDKVEVDYCQIKYIKKPKNTPPGTVTYSSNKTILVSALDLPYVPVNK